MKEVYFILCVMLMITLIILIFKFKESNNSKYWNLFIGIIISNLISNALAYLTFGINALGLGNAIVCIFIYSFSFIIIILILPIAVLKKSLKLG